MIVFAFRHANRRPEPDDELSPAGMARAKLLARMLSESGIRTAYCSSARRTQRTIEPLKEALGDRLDIVIVATGSANHVQEIVDQLKALPDDAVAAVVGHSDTIGPIVKGLTGKTIDPIESHQFDKMFVLSVAGGASMVAPMRYGEPT